MLAVLTGSHHGISVCKRHEQFAAQFPKAPLSNHKYATVLRGGSPPHHAGWVAGCAPVHQEPANTASDNGRQEVRGVVGGLGLNSQLTRHTRTLSSSRRRVNCLP